MRNRTLRIGVAALAASAMAAGGLPEASATTPTTYQPSSINEIRKPDGSGGWVDSGCHNFPIDNVWHAVVDQAGTPLITDERADLLTLDQGGYNAADISFNAAFNSNGTAPGDPWVNNKVGEGLNYVDNGDIERGFIHNPGLAISSDWTFATYTWFFGQRYPTYRSKTEAPGPGTIRWMGNSTSLSNDNRMYMLNTDDCTTAEFIGFNGLLRYSGYQALRQSNFDLDSNNRRASRDWAEPSCPSIPPLAPGYFRPNCTTPQVKESTARGGSGVSGVAGLLRVEEVLAATDTVDPQPIDHAIGITLPRNLIACDGCTGGPSVEYVWPAIVTDGIGTTITAGGDDFDPLPMGSRLRLSSSIDPDDFTGQAKVIVEALQTHGAIVHDSKGTADLTDVNGANRTINLAGEWHKDWNNTELLELRDLLLSDFELVDQEDMRADSTLDKQNDDFLEIR